MRLCHISGANFGKAAYGYSTVSIQGSVPAALAGQVAGNEFGPSWYTATKIAYQNGGTGSGPWIVQSYDTNTLALATLDGTGANRIAAGGGVWAKFRAGTGVTTSVGGLGPFVQAGLGDVSPNGKVAIVPQNNSGIGITVYSSTGSILLSRNSAQLVNPVIRIVDDILSYQDTAGWHLYDLLNGVVPTWNPQTAPVNWLVPVRDSNGQIWVIERTETLMIRQANLSSAYTLVTTPDAFQPDVMNYSSGVLRVGYCTNQGESTDSLKLIDFTFATGATLQGAVSGGTVVFTPGPTVTPAVVPIGPGEGEGLTDSAYPPYQAEFLQKGTKSPIVGEHWAAFFRNLSADVQTVSSFVQNAAGGGGGGGGTTQFPGFSTFTATGEVPVQATQPNDILTFTSNDASVTITTNPATKQIDFSTTGGGGGSHLVPLSNGAEPPSIVSNGAGEFVFTWITL